MQVDVMYVFAYVHVTLLILPAVLQCLLGQDAEGLVSRYDGYYWHWVFVCWYAGLTHANLPTLFFLKLGWVSLKAIGYILY